MNSSIDVLNTSSNDSNILTSNLLVWWQPQLLTLVYVTIVLCIIAFVVYAKVKKVKPDEAPKGVAFVAEQYVGLFTSEFKSISDGKIDRVGPYIFTLFSFLAIGNTAGLVGLEPVVTSYSVSLTLGLITWIGIYVFGILYQKMRFFKRYINPIELIGQFSPLISISFRIFGNITGGSILMFLIYLVTAKVWSFIPIIGDVNLLGMIVAPWFHMYFDIFGALVQAYVFSLLTSIYWTQEVEEGVNHAQQVNNQTLEVKDKQAKLQLVK